MPMGLAQLRRVSSVPLLRVRALDRESGDWGSYSYTLEWSQVVHRHCPCLGLSVRAQTCARPETRVDIPRDPEGEEARQRPAGQRVRQKREECALTRVRNLHSCVLSKVKER